MAVVADLLHEKVDALLRRPSAKMKIQRENDPRAAVRPPEQRPCPVLGRAVEAQVPQVELPPQRPALDPERRREELPVLVDPRQVVELQVVARQEAVFGDIMIMRPETEQRTVDEGRTPDDGLAP